MLTFSEFATAGVVVAGIGELGAVGVIDVSEDTLLRDELRALA